jgi:hypothetical protein
MTVRTAALAAVLALLAAVAARGDGMGTMMMVGNDRPYPDLAHAPRRDVALARRLVIDTRMAASRFDTVAKARRAGYVSRHALRRPGFTHLRKHGARFWGRVFDPTAPQSLIVWCPDRGACTVTTFMYRAPAGAPPSTWGDVLQWHRHGMRGTWMTHVWLARHTREALATCAPMRALAEALGIRPEQYHADVTEDHACPS